MLPSSKTTLQVLFGVSLVTANITAAKVAFFDLPFMGGVGVPAGFVAFGVAYLCSDLLVEYHGKAVAHDTVNGTIFALVVAYLLVGVAIIMPSAPFWELQSQYVAVLGNSASILVASVVALGVAQHIDVRLFSSLMKKTDGSHRWVRNCGSTMTSQAVDTVLFVGLGFGLFPLIGLGGSPILGWQLISIIVGQYIVKLIVALLDTVPFYAITEVTPSPSTQ